MRDVSVVMGVKNGQRYLERAVTTVLGQNDVDLELLVMDDGSTDATGAILANIAERDPRLRVFTQKNRGLGASLNTLIAESDTPLIARMDADDLSLPWRLADQVAYLRSRTEVQMVGTWAAFLGPDGLVRGCQCYPDDDRWLGGQLLAGRNVFVHSSMMMRRSALDRLEGPYRFRFVQDYDLWLRIAELGPVGMVKRVGLVSRWHGARVSGRTFTARRHLHESILALARERRQTGAETMTPTDLEAAAFAAAEEGSVPDIDESWYDAMSAVYRRDFRIAARLFGEAANKGGPLAAKAKRWRLALTLPFSRLWLPRVFSPLRYMIEAENSLSDGDHSILEGMLAQEANQGG